MNIFAAALTFLVSVIAAVAWRISVDRSASRAYQSQSDISRITPMRDRRPE